MKVLFLSSWFPNRVTLNNGDFVERHALAVSKICKTAVLHVCPDKKIRGRIMEIYEIQKKDLFEVIIYIRTIPGRHNAFSRKINNLLYGLAYYIGYWIVKSEIGKPDVIHANIIVPVSRIAHFLHRITRIPYIISEHWTIYLTPERKSLGTGHAKAVAKAFALVPVTAGLKEALISFGYKNRYFVVPNVVDTHIFSPALSASNRVKKRLLHVSSMKEGHKNISGIIRSVKTLAGKRDDFIFTFTGDASDEQKEMVRTNGLEGCVDFTGEVEHSRVAYIMKESDALVMFSNVENLPCVIIEAISCGLPVISSQVGGISEVVNSSNGILIEPGDETGLSRAMDHLLDNLHNYDKKLLHEYAVKNFSMNVIASRFLEIYNLALNKIEK